MTTIRTALVGYGNGGKNFHAPFLATNPEYSLDAVVSRSLAAAPGRLASADSVEIIAGPAELWARATEFDLAVITTPTGTHAELVEQALHAGLDVAVDKPIAATSADARRMAARAEELDRVLSVYHNRRYDAEVRTARALITSGRLGEIVRLELNFERNVDPAREGWRDELSSRAGGGVSYDLGSHLIDMAQYLLGPIRTSSGVVRNVSPERRSDDDMNAILHHESGAVTVVTCSWVAAQTGPKLRLIGTEGAYSSAMSDPQETALKAGTVPGGPDWGEVPRSDWGSVLDPTGRHHPEPTLAGDYGLFYTDFARHRRGEGPNPCPPVDAVRTVEIIESLLDQRVAA